MKSPQIVTTAGAGRPLFLGSLVFLLLCISSALAQAPSRARSGNQPTNREFVPGRILVKFNNDVAADQAHEALAVQQSRCAGEIADIGVHMVELPAGAVEAAYLHAFQQRPDVEFAELDHIGSPQSVTPNDPLYSSEWHLTKILAPDAWSTTTGSSSITIAIIDTGVETTHPDLSSKMVAGWNFWDGNSDTTDVTGHGTMVAGTVAASTNNSQGVASLCWGCRLMPIRATDASGNAYGSLVASGLTWAADHGARVAVVGFAPFTIDSSVSAAAQYFYNHGGVVIMPVGNFAGWFDSSADKPYELIVSMTDPNDLLYSNSSTGNSVDLSAPGVVYTTWTQGRYASAGGTSFSAAIVGGVAALVLSVNPALTPAQVTGILQQSADDKGPLGWDTGYGWGRVNALRAVDAVGPPKINTTTGLSSSLNPSIVGQTVTFTATVSPAAATGTVTFWDGAATLGTGTLVAGIATFSTSALAAGGHSITASYGGDSNYNGSTSSVVSQTVNKVSTATVVTSSLNPSTSGQTVTFTATVSPSTATGTVTFLDGATTLGTGTLSLGIATYSTSSLSVASHSITASYSGNSNYNGSTSVALTQTVNTAGKTNTTTSLASSLNPSTFGQAVTFTATVSPAAATGTVTFSDGVTTLGTVTVSAGSALLSTSSLAAGSHSIAATYSGDSNYNTSTANTVQTVNKANTATSLVSNLNPSIFGQLVTLTATVSPSSASGTVTFLDGGVTLGTGVLAGGIATFSTSNLAAGAHSMSASYSGNSNYNSSTTSASAVSQTVNKANTTTTLSSSLNPSTFGQLVTLTGTVSPSTATGTVTFLDGGVTLGSGTLAGGIATFSTSSLAAGSHSITASYGGSGNYNSSASNAVSQTVNNTAADFSITASPASVNVKKGAIARYTVTVTGSGGFNSLVNFSMSAAPLGPGASFSPSTINGSGSTIMSVPTTGLRGTYTQTIIATSGNLVHSRTVSLRVTGGR